MKPFYSIVLLVCAHYIALPAFADDVVDPVAVDPVVDPTVVDDSWVEENAKLSAKLKDDTTFSDEPVESIGTVWTGSAELGLVATSGNTDNQSVNFGFNVSRDTENWRQTLQAKMLRVEDQGAKTAENLLAEFQADRKLTKYDYLFADINYEQDEFAGFDNQAMASVGYGRKIIDSDALKLKGEVGIGMRHRELVTGEKSDEGILGLTGILDWQISETASFQEELTARIGSDLTTTRSVSSITVAIKDNLALKFSFEIKNNSDVPLGIEKTDTLTTASLVVNF